MTMRQRILLASLLAAWIGSLALLAGCGGGGGGGGPTETAADLTAQGWVMYEAGNFSGAVGKFIRATQLDANYADAYNGLGWSYGKLDSLARAVEDFRQAILKGMTTADPYAGRAPAYRDVNPPKYRRAIVVADSALAKSPAYVFSHHAAFDYRDLHLINAQSHFGLKEYTEAKAEVDILDPANTLNPASPSFVDSLAAKIEDLAGTIL
jgi:tetratricopeptide (TPR) repeat protein